MDPAIRGWLVTAAGSAINLTLGGLYAWPVIAHALVRPIAAGGDHGWTVTQAGLPFAFAVAAFALSMIAGGRLQDRIGPRWTATAGGVLAGLGLVVASLSPVRLASPASFPTHMVLGFGLMTGAGIGLAYASTTPAAVKWFAPRRRGAIAGLVVCGFGLSPILTAPASYELIAHYGVDRSLLYLGIVALGAIVVLAQLLSDPLPGFVPPHAYAEPPGLGERSPRQMLSTAAFYSLWGAFALAAFCGLAVMGVLSESAALVPQAIALPGTAGFLVALALGNGLGRPIAGLLSDRFGRRVTVVGSLGALGVSLAALPFVTGTPALAAVSLAAGLTYGSTLALFPVIVYDYYGTRDAGANYGLLFTAWGVGGVGGWYFAAVLVGRATAAASQAIPSGLALCAALAFGAAVLASTARPPSAAATHRHQARDLVVPRSSEAR